MLFPSLFFALVPLLVSAPSHPCQESSDSPHQEERGDQKAGIDPSRPDPASYMGRAFVFEVDLPFARAAGWVNPDTEDAELMERCRAALEARLRRSAYFTEAVVLAEPEHRLAAVFVGRQDPALEKFLLEGIEVAGHFSVCVAAGEQDPASANLEAERERFTRWFEAHPNASAVVYDGLPAEKGGSAAGIRWRFLRGKRDPRRAVALLAERRLDIARADLTDGLLVATPVEEPRGAFQLQCTLREDAAGRLRELRAAAGDRRLVLLVDERVLGRLPKRDPDSRWDIVFPHPLPADAARVLVFSIAGGALPAPLRFVEFSKRPLPGVVQEGE